jgi:leucyl/phenylalanyl-tRNA--protein transferase
MIPLLRSTDPPEAFPPVEDALTEPDGLLCAGGDLSPARLLAAYRRGIFPWYSEGQPILWWSPDPRLVLFPDELKISRSLAKTLRNRGFRVSFDRCFAAVAAHCAASGDRAAEGTWISPAMHAAYVELHRLGYAHSVEVWDAERLVGGLYGLKLGRVFFGESMFSTERDASKVALCHLVQALRTHEVGLIDCQVPTAHLVSLGARLMPRAAFVAHLQREIQWVAPAPMVLSVEA